VIPHNEYGGSYLHIVEGITISSMKKGPVILGQLDERFGRAVRRYTTMM